MGLDKVCNHFSVSTPLRSRMVSDNSVFVNGNIQSAINFLWTHPFAVWWCRSKSCRRSDVSDQLVPHTTIGNELKFTSWLIWRSLQSVISITRGKRTWWKEVINQWLLSAGQSNTFLKEPLFRNYHQRMVRFVRRCHKSICGMQLTAHRSRAHVVPWMFALLHFRI